MKLENIIKDRIPQALLERVVYDQGVVTPEQRDALFKVSGLSPQQIARKVVAIYSTQAFKLACGLHKQVEHTDFETARLLLEHFNNPPNHCYHNLQAGLIGAFPTLSLAQLSAFLESVKNQVCLIAARKGHAGKVKSGTGFLVAPDLILTCRHVLEDFNDDDNFQADGNQIELHFDFHSGQPVNRLGVPLPEVRTVGVHPKWRVASRSYTKPDGLKGPLNPEETARISGALDFLLLRLDQKVGLQPLKQGGGRRRQWIEFPSDDVPQNLQVPDWIIIPQHPGGFPQRIDLGRYKEPDHTKTRIRYSTNTAQGTSGAPCFNQDFKLVGVHNAYVGPVQNPEANQAIRVDHIAAVVRNLIQADVKEELKKRLRRWSTSRPGEKPRVILGREKLLQWLEASATATPRSLADRVYVAQANDAGAGCTFSSEVLHAEIRDSLTPRAVYGSGGQQMPATVEDFLLSLLRELGIDLGKLPSQHKMPQRPGQADGDQASQPLIGEVDKVERWISDELPSWIGGVITAHVEIEVDARDSAKQAVEYYKQRSLEVPKDILDQANAKDRIPLRPNPWDHAYIVVDELRSPKYQGKGAHTKLTGEILSLIAALVKGKPENAMHPGLKGMRWMFLGYLPDFIRAAESGMDGASVEILDPTAISTEEVLEIFTQIDYALLEQSEVSRMARILVGPVVTSKDMQDTADSRLVFLQGMTNQWAVGLLNGRAQ